MSSPEKPTIKTVAAAAGVSASTVSRALRNDPQIPEKTRLRIQEVAAEIGYQKHPLVSALMTHLRTTKEPGFQGVIAYLDTSFEPRVTERWGAVQHFRAGSGDRAASLGYEIEPFRLKDYENRQRPLEELLTSRGIRAVIIQHLPHPQNPALEIAFDTQSLTCCALGLTIHHPPVHSVSNSHYTTVNRAFDRLRELGYRRIGLAVLDYTDETVDHKFSAAFHGRTYALPTEEQVRPLLYPPGDKAALLDWIAAEKPDAIIGLDDDAVTWIQDGGYTIPDDVAYAHLDLSPNSEGMAGIDQNNTVAGAAAVDLVVQGLHNNEYGTPEVQREIFVHGSWKDGWTVKGKAKEIPERKKKAKTAVEK